MDEAKKRTIRNNLILAGCLFVLYTATYLIDLFTFKSMVFFSYFETAGTLLAVTVILHRMDTMYFSGITLFALIAQYGGTMFNLYGVIPVYDLILHLASGCLLLFFGHYFLGLILKRHPEVTLPRSLILWFCWFFSVACAGIWEIFEFTVDQLFGFDSQIRGSGVMDTMTDVIAGTAGAVLGIFLLRYLIIRMERKKGNQLK